MEQIYIILKSLTVDEEVCFESVPSTWCDSAEDASELLRKTEKRLREWYPDTTILGADERHLHVYYTDDEGKSHEACYWVEEIRRFDSFAW